MQQTIIKISGEHMTRKVWLNGAELKPVESQGIVNHSPDGFNWGYGGSGPAQLALAICLKLFNPQEAVKRYQQFKWDWIVTLPIDSNFSISIPWDKAFHN